MPDSPLLIIGGGAAGLASALAARERLSELLPAEAPHNHITLVERESAPGGVLRQCIHRGFGLTRFGSDLTGIEYMRRFTEPFAVSGIRFLPETSALDVFPDQTVLVTGPHTGRSKLSFKHLILASGCFERSFQSLLIAGTRPSGIYTAGEAQYLINCCHKAIGEKAVILGSGDMGQILARRLTLEGKKVLAVVEKAPVCGGLARNRRNCLEKYNIPVLLSSTVSSVHGEGRLDGVTVQNIHTKEERFLSCDTLVCAVGLIPEQRILRGIRKDGALPSWVSLCGNCSRVHRVVDSVTLQAEEAGRAAIELLYH